MILDNHSTDTPANVDPVDEIAALFLAEEEAPGEVAESDPTQEQTQDETDTEDSNDAEELSDESTEGDDVEVDESDDETDPELHEMLGIDASQIEVTDNGDFLINVKIDGEKSQHMLSDVIKNYQLEGSNTNKSKALAEDRKAFESGVEEQVANIKASLERNQALAQVLEREIMSDYEKVDWEDLRQYDPAEWGAKRQEFAAKYQRIQRVQAELAQQGQEATDKQAKEMTEQQQVYLQDQWNQMVDKNPTWSDEATYKKDMGVLRTFAEDTYGFSQQHLNQVSDLRLIEVLKDAKKFREGATASTKKVTKKPRFQKKAGGKVKPKVTKLEALTRAARKAKGSNKRSLQVDAVAELLIGG